MSLLGFDAIGRWALGQLPGGHQTTILSASAGAFTITGVAATFTITEAAAAGALSLAGVSASFSISWPNAAGAFAWSGVAASFTVTERAAAGAFTINGQPANEIILEADGPAAWTISTVPPLSITRTGDDYEFKLGGIGHYKLELERAKQLAKITRKAPGPVDLRTAPTFKPIGRPPVAPAPQGANVAAIQNQRMAAQMQAAAQAKRRRDEQAILLLAS